MKIWLTLLFFCLTEELLDKCNADLIFSLGEEYEDYQQGIQNHNIQNR